MDYELFRLINEYAGAHPILDAIGVIFAKYLIFVIPLGAVLVKGRQVLAFFRVGASAALTYGINAGLGTFFFKPRPFITYDVNQLVHVDWSSKSFPSDHSGLAWSMAVTLFLFDRRLGACAMILAAFVSFGRVFAGVHYPSDAFAGALVGTISAVLVYKILAFKKI